ncbi:hypothetical protein [Aquimarina agarivorans]|uniref:hypothetical protein n=1 Tax=Aquimarina agarivorans TaxID=980584 RepID=UPI000248E64E|nr:hypothetical protein [Aquimarina agarivorans]
MKAQLEKELKDLAIDLLSLQHQNTEDLKQKVADIYDRLCVLAYAEKQETEQPVVPIVAAVETASEKEFDRKNEGTDFGTSLTGEDTTVTTENMEAAVTETPTLPEPVVSSSETKSISEIIPDVLPEAVAEETLFEFKKTVENVSETSEQILESTLAAEQHPEEAQKSFEATEQKLEQFPIKETPEVIVNEIPTPPTDAPQLLHELEALTAGFDLPEFDPVPPPTSTIETTVPATPTEADVFSNATAPIADPTPTKVNEVGGLQQRSSLNDSLKKTIQIGLNDRIGFVKHLFDGNQDDYTRVLSQLNTLETHTEASNFINHMVKPEYNNWENKEAFETRFLEVVFRKFDL